MNIYRVFLDHIRDAVRALAAEGVIAAVPDLSRVTVETPRDPTHGDLSTNAAMVVAKDAGMKPRDLAEALAGKLRAVPDVTAVSVAGPGFVNLTLGADVWRRGLAAALAAGPEFGRSDLGGGERVNVEYVSANPTGPMHVGHCRGAVFGDALANVLAFGGYDVTREYYINDAGQQVLALGRSAFLRYREALGETITIPDGLYPGAYLVPVGRALADEHGRGLLDRPEAEAVAICREKAVAMMMDMIRDDLAALDVRHAVFFSERSLQHPVDKVGALIEALKAADHVYVGRLPPPKGAPVEDWEDREQVLFRATAFGDDIDRPLVKSDGGYTYFASDIAYHKDKFDRGFATQIDVWGADHGGYIKRMQAVVKAATGGRASLDVEIVQLVKLMRAGEPVKMSKRSGEFVTLREVVDEVGRDAVRFMMLMRKNDATLEFDLAKVIEQSKDNPVFYVQYGHARGRSVLRNVAEAIPGLDLSPAALAGADLGRLDDPGELAILKDIASWPRVVEQAAQHREPHRIAFYLHDLASAFHAHWNRGKDSPYLRFIIETDRQLTVSRSALVAGVVTVLASGLSLLGVGAPEEMR